MTAAKRTGQAPPGGEFLPGLEERWAEIRAVPMRYFVGGEGPPVVLVHGLSGAAANWTAIAPELAARRRVLVPDLPGHGGSGPLPAAPTLSGFADRVRLLAEREGMLPASFVGHSFGASVALRTALRWPSDVTALVLAASAGIASGSRWAQFWLSFFARAKPGRRIAPYRTAVGRRDLLRYPVFGYWGASDPPSLPARAVEALLAGHVGHADTLSAARALVAEDPRRDLEGVRCPVLVLWGARDRQVPVEDAFEYARRLGAPLRTIADCGHLLIVERPEACLDAIEGFLARVEA